jgi:hypothetical protein
MSITSILRDWADGVSIVRIVTTDTIATVNQTGYITAQAANIAALNNAPVSHPFDWVATDVVLVAASDGWAFYTISANFTSLTPLVPGQYPIQYAKADITAAQFNAMYTTPLLLVPAQGANTLILVDRMALVMTFVAAAYAAGGVVAAQYDSTAHGAGVAATNTEAAADFFAAASTTFTFEESLVLKPFTTTVNKGIYLSNATGVFTTGDGTWVAHVWYRVIPTTGV